MAVFTVDWEHWGSFKPYGKYWEDNDPLIEEPTNYLLDLLRRHQIKAIFYCVGWMVDNYSESFRKIKDDGHVIGDHTYYHKMPSLDMKFFYERLNRKEEPFRAPRFKGQKRLYSGGFWFRAMPYNWLKKEVEKTGIFFVHPHDVLLEHPDCGLRIFDRRLGLKNSRDKLERLCREVVWNEPV